MPLQAVESRRLYRQIADQLANLISRGEFPAGARLPAERELAQSLGVSRTSVREAIISLEMIGLVEVRVGTGIFVAAPHPVTHRAGDAGPGPFELLAARKLVEGEIAALAARNAKPSDIALLRENVAQMRARLDDFAARESIDQEFHVALARTTGNGSLELVVEGLWQQRAELWGRLQRHFHTAALARETITDHAAIVEAIARHDARGAKAALHRHLDRVVREFQRGVAPDAGARSPVSSSASEGAGDRSPRASRRT